MSPSRHLGLFALLLSSLVVDSPRSRADDKACQRVCQRNFDDCRDECPRQGKQTKACLSKCLAGHTACLAACR